jgi:hypothetical protein
MSGPDQRQFDLELPRFNPALLDPEDPFELDAVNTPHLAKHEGCDPELLYSMWASDCRFLPADHGPADWFLVADLGGETFFAPVMPSSDSDPSKCRPIGLRRAPQQLEDLYFEALSGTISEEL